MKSARLLTTAALALATVAATAVPASANDTSLTVSYGGVVRARATWDDSIDTLCVKALHPMNIDTASTWMVPANGVGKTYRMSDLTDTSGRHCTRNLSIPEDKKYVLHLHWISESGPSRTATPKSFYS